MKDKEFFKSYDVWEYITQAQDAHKDTGAGTIQRFIDLREYSDKFAGYMTSPVVTESGVQYTAKSVRFFDRECLGIFLDTMPQKSIILHSAIAVYVLIGSELDTTTYDPIVIDEPYLLKKYITFRYAEC